MHRPEPRRPDVPALEATGLAEVQRYRGNLSTWVPLAETLTVLMQTTRSWPHGRPTPEWHVHSIVVHGEGSLLPVYITLEGRDEQGDSVALNVNARRG